MKLKNYISHHLLAIFIILISIVFATQAVALEYAATLITPKQTETEEKLILSKVNIEESNQAFNELNDSLVELVSQYDQTIAIKIVDLKTDESIAINPEEDFRMASIYKLFVAQELYRLSNIGELDINQTVSTAEGKYTVEECIQHSISSSNNACGRVLRELIGADSVTPQFVSDNYPNTDLSGDYPVSNAEDIAQLLKDIYTNKFINNDNLIFYMKNQQIRTKLPLGLTSGELAHKTGDLEDLSHDVGILYQENSDKIIVVLSKDWQNPYTDSPKLFKQVLDIIYLTL